MRFTLLRPVHPGGRSARRRSPPSALRTVPEPPDHDRLLTGRWLGLGGPERVPECLPGVRSRWRRARRGRTGGCTSSGVFVFSVVVAALAVGGAVAWIALLLWGAREDGRDQRTYDSALRRYRRRY